MVVGFLLLNAVFAGAVLVLGPSVADQTIGRAAWGLVLAAHTAGAVLGAVIAMRLRVRRLLLVGVACVASELLLVLGLALAPRVGVLLAAALLAGIGIEVFSVAWETTMQEHIPADRLARVYSYDAVGSLLAVPIGQVAAGPIALAIGTEPTLLVGAGIVGVVVIGMVANRDIRRLEHRLPVRT